MLKPSVKKQLKKIDKKQAIRVLAKIDLLADDPFPLAAKPLVGENAYRLRVGDYRVIYEIRQKVLIVYVVRIGHRREIYRS